MSDNKTGNPIETFTFRVEETIGLPPAVSDFIGKQFPGDYYAPAAAQATRVISGPQREILANEINALYARAGIMLNENEPVAKNIRSLKNENTFTVTGGHQLQLFGGPMFFLSKLAHTVAYARQLSAGQPDKHFVPVYWMASEDHDFEEIASIHLFGKTLTWQHASGGPVGELDMEGVAPLLDELETILGEKPDALEILQILKDAYLPAAKLTAATARLVHSLFGRFGLVCLDASTPALKRFFVPVMRRELAESFSSPAIEAAAEQELASYPMPLAPREINLFYIPSSGDTRRRIVRAGDDFSLAGAPEFRRTQAEILAELESHPERFSPNVCLRPVYQEVLLPNLAYIGGPGELNYWLFLKRVFAAANVPYPELLLRYHFNFLSAKAAGEVQNAGLALIDLYGNENDLEQKYFELNNLKSDALPAMDMLMGQYLALRDAMQGLPSSLVSNAVKAMNNHQKEIKKWKGDVEKAMRATEEKTLAKIHKAAMALKPGGEPQERVDNFIPYYLKYGNALVPTLIDNCTDAQGKLCLIIG